MAGRPSRWSLAGQLFALQAAIVVIVLTGVAVAAYLQFDETNRDSTAEEMLGVAHTLAASPDVRAALHAPDPVAVLQPLAERVRTDTATDFVVVMRADGIRLSHPNPAEIGRVFQGTIAPALRGDQHFTETYTGTLGPSVRAVVPVLDGGRVVGLVSVGRTVEAVSRELERQTPLFAGAAVVALLLAAGGSWLVSRWLRRSTHDLGPAELARMYEYYDAVLHAVREGLLLLDRSGRIQLVNDEARRLLALAPDVQGRRVDEVGLPAELGAALAGGEARDDEIHLTADRIVVVSQGAARWAGRHLGTVVTLRDHTELRALVSELQTIRGFADSLNAQAHEAANQLHTVISLIELGRADDALEFATTELAVSQQLTDAVLAGIAVPELAALVVGKAAEAGERGVALQVADGTFVPAGVADPRDLVTIVGNLLDNAIDAAEDAPAPRWVRISGGVADDAVELRVADSGPGIAAADAERAFARGWSTKPHDGLGRGLGLALARQAARRHGGWVELDVAADGSATGTRGAEFAVRLPLVRA
ncbi:sensor histidine kinase [Pseudonocardia xinjiangensis]|uniref:histidine kinase n=1 Tax=Pseudonocardia xinjiangensis TaxID=75289 RepID=A0ABX1RAF0_9PSEU|nr:sensor histidine kinase [Pseudonocardia xinjiangensis]NMH77002.1 sensor histidine kinase [Pseudonocardia xinjiangensis]